MSPGHRRHFFVLWITLLTFVLFGPLQVMAIFDPYISEFEYAPEFHPSRNPSCPRRWARASWEERRSPEEGGPVGQEPSIEIRAVLVRCPKSHEEMAEIPMNGNACNITAGRSQDILEFHGFDRDEPAHHSEIRNCRRKLIVTMKFNNIGKTRTQEQFVVVDHVLDPVTMRKARLLNPFVFKVRQEQVLQLYGLKFQSVVNGEAREEVINKKSANYTGCDDSLNNPTCGQMMFDGKPVPYSQGFCCSCDPDVNAARQSNDRSESHLLRASQKIIRGRNVRRRPGYSGAGTRGVFAQFSEDTRTPIRGFNENLKAEDRKSGVKYGEESYMGVPTTREIMSKKEKRLKSSHLMDIFKKHRNQADEDFPSVRDQSPSRGKIEPYIDAIRNKALWEKERRRNAPNLRENFGRERSVHKLRTKGRQKSMSKSQNVDLTAELAELEEEYEAIQNSKKKVDARETEESGIMSDNSKLFRNNSKCKDFRKLARDHASHSNVSSDEYNEPINLAIVENINGLNNKKKRNQLTDKRTSLKTDIADKLQNDTVSKNDSVVETGPPKYSASSNAMELSSFANKSTSAISSIPANKNTTASGGSSLSSNTTQIVSHKNIPASNSLIMPSPPSPKNNTDKSIPTASKHSSSILRQELINDKLYFPFSTSDKTSSGSSSELITTGGFEIPERSDVPQENNLHILDNQDGKNISEPIALRGSLKNQYADWVIKYGKMHSNHFIKPQVDEPIQDYNLDLYPDGASKKALIGQPQDSLSYIADKVMKAFEFAENEGASGHEERVEFGPAAAVQTLENPEIGGKFINQRNPHQYSIDAEDDASELSDETIHQSEILPHQTEYTAIAIDYYTPSITKEMPVPALSTLPPIKSSGNPDNISSLDSEAKSPTRVVGLHSRGAKIEGRPRNKSHLGDEDPTRKAIEPALIVRGTGDMVKGNFRYQDQSATVIAEHHPEDSQASSATDQGYIFRDENGKTNNPKNLLLGNLREYLKSVAPNSDSRLQLMGKKIERSLEEDGNVQDESMQNKLNKLNNLVRDSLKSRRRSFRSIEYDDPFSRGNVEKQAKIDKQIEKEFAEITEALYESSDRKKHAPKISSQIENDSSEDSMLRNFAVMLNRIPKVDVLASGAEVALENGNQKPTHFSDDLMKVKSYGNKKERPIRYSANEGAQGMLDKISHVQGRKNHKSKDDKHGPEEQPTLEPPTFAAEKTSDNAKDPISYHSMGSSTVKYYRSNDRDGYDQMSQTNIGEIVKEIINNDYPTPPSCPEYSGRKKNMAMNTYSKFAGKSGSISSPNFVSKKSNDGKFGAKFHDSNEVTPILYAYEQDSGDSLPPDESTFATTSRKSPKDSNTEIPKPATDTSNTDVKNSLDPDDTFNRMTSPHKSISTYTSPPTITYKSTHSSNDLSTENWHGTRAQIIQGTGSPLESTGTELPGIKNIDLMNEGITTTLSSISVESPHGTELGKSYEEKHAMIQRSPIQVHEMTFFKPNGADDSSKPAPIAEKELLKAENLELKKALAEARNLHETQIARQPEDIAEETAKARGEIGVAKACDGKNDDANVKAMTVHEDSYDDETDGEKSKTVCPQKTTTSCNHGVTRNDKAHTVYEKTTPIAEDTTTVKRVTCATTTTEKAMTVYEEPKDDEEITKSSKNETICQKTTPSGDSSSCSPISKDSLVPPGNNGGSSIILIKTYSVSQNPKEFLDNYEFPLGVKKILLKKLNVTTLVRNPIDPEKCGSFKQKVDKLIVNEQEDQDDSETDQKIFNNWMKVGAKKGGQNFKQSFNSAENLLRSKNRRTIHEPSNADLKLQQLENMYQTTRSAYTVTDPDLTMNEPNENSRDSGHLISEFPSLNVTSSTLVIDTLPPDAETTPYVWKDDANGTNIQPDSVMEQPIFTQKDERNKSEFSYSGDIKDRQGFQSDQDLNENLDHRLVFFYDYDQDSDGDKPHAKVRRSSEFRVAGNISELPERSDVNSERITKSKKPANWGVVQKIRRSGFDIDIGNGEGTKCENQGSEKWQGKMDRLKSKKHQDVLKEYLNWNPNSDTTGVKIFSAYSTSGMLPKQKDPSSKYQRGHDSSTMSILLVEDSAHDKSQGQKVWKNPGSKSDESCVKALNETAETLGDEEILDKLSKTPIDGDLMIISVKEKNKSNVTIESPFNGDGIKKAGSSKRETTRGGKRSVIKKRDWVPSIGLGLSKAGVDSKQKKTVSLTRRKTKNSGAWNYRKGRRLMSTDQMKENYGNVLQKEPGGREGYEEILQMDKVLPEYENLITKDDGANIDYLESSYKKSKRDKMNPNWDQLVDKIIVKDENDKLNEWKSVQSSKKRNSHINESQEVPFGEQKTAMEKLNFFDADKYIKIMAKRISQLSKVDNTEQDLTTEKQVKLIESTRKTKQVHDNNDENGNVDDVTAALAEDDENYGTVEKKLRTESDGDESKEFYNSEDVDSQDPKAYRIGNLETLVDYENVIPDDGKSEPVHNSRVSQNNFLEKLGSDFEISISGKVHINGGSDEQPMSISIEGVNMDNLTRTSPSNKMRAPSKFKDQIGLEPLPEMEDETGFQRKEGDHSYYNNINLGHNTEKETLGNNGNKKRMYFGEADAATSSNVTEMIRPKYDFSVSGTPELMRNNLDANRMTPELYEPEMSKRRKTFYNVLVRADPRYEKRPVHRLRDLNEADESVQHLDEDVENLEHQDPSETSRKKNAKSLTADEPVFDFAKLELRHPKPVEVNFNHLVDEVSLDDKAHEPFEKGDDSNMIEESPSLRRHVRRYREERAMRENTPESAQEFIQHYSGGKENSFLEIAEKGTPDIEFVKLIPVELLNQDERRISDNSEFGGSSLMEERPTNLITSELPEPEEFDINTPVSPSKPTKIKPVKNMIAKLLTRSMGHLKTEDRDSDVEKPRKLYEEHFSETRQSPGQRKIDVFTDHKRRLKAHDSSSGSPEYFFMEKASGTSKFSDSNTTLDSRQSDFGQKSDISQKGIATISGPSHIKHMEIKKSSNSTDGENSIAQTVPELPAPLENSKSISKEVSDKKGVSTGDIDLQSSKSLDNSASKETPLKGVKISSPSEYSGPRLPGEKKELLAAACDGGGCETSSESLEDVRRTIQLKNLMSMLNFVKKMEDLLPDSEEGSELLEKEVKPGGVVEVESVLVLPEDSSGVQLKAIDGAKRSQTTSERVVEIGEGVKHEREKENPDIFVLESPTRVEALPFQNDFGSNLIPEKSTSQLTKQTNTGKAKTFLFQDSGTHLGGETSNFPEKPAGNQITKELEDASKSQKLFETFRNKIYKRLEDHEKREKVPHSKFSLQTPTREENFRRSRHERSRENAALSGRDYTMNDYNQKIRQVRTAVPKSLSVVPKGDENRSPSRKIMGTKLRNTKRRTQHLTKPKAIDKRKSKKHKNKKKKKKWWPFKRRLLTISEDLESTSSKIFARDTDAVNQRKSKKQRLKQSSSHSRKKRQIRLGGSQVRGGQDCMDRRHPAHVNAAKYQESAHCLRFSDLWYSVYQLENPIMEHTIYLQLFEKHTLSDGTTHWDDLTQGSMVRLGTFVRHQRDSAPTIAFTYSGAKIASDNRAHNLDPSRDRLLVPSPVQSKKTGKYPDVKGGSGEYLVVQSNAINKDGNECDKAGIGFATFANQANRCGSPKGTCLKHQPLAYWRHDIEARENGRRGCYFLSNFASVPNNPIKYNVSGSGSQEYLGLEYHSAHVSAIDIEVRADYNAIVRVGSSGRVTEVYVDSTALEHTVVTIVISNMGLASSPYQSRISDCPTGLPISWSKAKGAMQVIPPQHDQKITLDLYGKLFVEDFHCSVEVVNHRGELVAMRRIRVQRMDRCFCVWHCLCACVGSVTGLECQPMSPEHYHAAGFQGPVPVASMERSMMSNSIKDVMIFSALLILILLLSGMLKWLVGVFVPSVGRWGLDILLIENKMGAYFEPELKCRCIVTDIDGDIVHPETGQKTVRICSRRTEFLLNLIFFLTWPIAVCCNCARSSLATREENCCPDNYKVCLLNDRESSEESCPKLICVNTYGDSRNSKLEAEDTRYVMSELKRSKASLQEGGRRCKTGLRNRK